MSKKESNPLPVECGIYDSDARCQHLHRGTKLCNLAGVLSCCYQQKINKPAPPPVPPPGRLIKEGEQPVKQEYRTPTTAILILIDFVKEMQRNDNSEIRMLATKALHEWDNQR